MNEFDKYMNLAIQDFYAVFDAMAKDNEDKATALLVQYNEHRKAQLDAERDAKRGPPRWATNTGVYKMLFDEKSKQLMETREAIEAMNKKMRIEADRVSMIDTSGNDVSLAKWEELLEAHTIEANTKIAAQDQVFERITINYREEKAKAMEQFCERRKRLEDTHERTTEKLRQKLRDAEELYEECLDVIKKKETDKYDEIESTVAIKRENMKIQVDGMRANLDKKKKHLEGMAEAAKTRVQKAMEQESPALLRLKAELNELVETQKEIEDWLQQK